MSLFTHCGVLAFDFLNDLNRFFLMKSDNQLSVSSEVGTLRRLLIHSPDRGLGKVVPSKAQDWLFEDIVHLDTMRREEYDLSLIHI